MAHLWRDVEAKGFSPFPLEGSAEALTLDPDGPQLRSVGAGWVLLVPPASPVRLNGCAIPLGIHLLADRDEIRLGSGERVFYSTEEPVAIVEFHSDGRALYCPRCKQAIEEGTPAVRCPNPQCRTWHHQVPPDLPCWTYSERCGLCGWPTDLSAGFRWIPEAD